MAKWILLLCLFILFMACNTEKVKDTTASLPFNKEEEMNAITKIIEAETDAFYNRDYEGWKKYFIQADYTFQGWNMSDGNFEAKVGWPEVDARTAEYISGHPVKSASAIHPKVERRNMVIKFYNDSLAYLVWDQYNSDGEMKNYTHSKDERIMEKHNGEWMIANISSFWDYKNIIPADSLK
jgi:hypothetical protein